jgi:hypothetical protein
MKNWLKKISNWFIGIYIWLFCIDLTLDGDIFENKENIEEEDKENKEKKKEEEVSVKDVTDELPCKVLTFKEFVDEYKPINFEKLSRSKSRDYSDFLIEVNNPLVELKDFVIEALGEDVDSSEVAIWTLEQRGDGDAAENWLFPGVSNVDGGYFVIASNDENKDTFVMVKL